jgi:hypothetical protein
VIEWAERMSNDEFRMANIRRVKIDILNENERRIIYEDSGA